jgi:hypothetical protein
MKSPSAPFTILSWIAIVAAGIVGAAIANHPTKYLVWMIAYLVLVVGASQHALGIGLVRFAPQPPRPGTVWTQWVLLNIGHAGVIAGTLAGLFPLVAAATVPYFVAVAWLALGARPNEPRSGLLWYRVMIAVLLISSLVGATLSRVAHGG